MSFEISPLPSGLKDNNLSGKKESWMQECCSALQQIHKQEICLQ